MNPQSRGSRAEPRTPTFTERRPATGRSGGNQRSSGLVLCDAAA